ncbi:MAG: hypothetical protein J6K13_00885 [Clostridia bacterium]|nr:hypothetical protein [Clostridia bacterium]
MKKLIAMALCLILLCSCAAAEEAQLMVRMGGSFGLGVDVNGVIWGWGDNRNGQLGIESRKIISKPVQVAQGMNGQDILDIQCGNVNTLFIMKDGTVYTCGANSEGQQGIASVKDRVLIPVQIPELKNIVQANCGFGHCLALDKDGHVWAWGRNHVGQIGDGTRQHVDTPKMLALENIVRWAAAASTAWSWMPAAWCTPGARTTTASWAARRSITSWNPSLLTWVA